MKYKSISIFLPVLNEQDNVEECVLAINKYIKKHFKDYEILVVANGSTDNTSMIVKKLGRHDLHIKLVDDKKIGYGEALKSGFNNSKKDLIFYTDGDNQFDIEEMDRIFPMLDRYDVISAYRINRQDPLMRIIVADIYNMLIRTLFNLKVRDIDSSFKLFKKEVIKSMKLRSRTGLIDAEVLIKAQKNGFKIGQVGVRHYPRTAGQTIYASSNNFVKPKVVIDILKEIRTLWGDLR